MQTKCYYFEPYIDLYNTKIWAIFTNICSVFYFRYADRSTQLSIAVLNDTTTECYISSGIAINQVRNLS